MPEGKASGVRCIQLDDNGLCEIFGQDARPNVCLNFKAEILVCGETKEQALENIYRLEKLTS
jgi:hypothetical protein